MINNNLSHKNRNNKTTGKGQKWTTLKLSLFYTKKSNVLFRIIINIPNILLLFYKFEIYNFNESLLFKLNFFRIRYFFFFKPSAEILNREAISKGGIFIFK